MSQRVYLNVDDKTHESLKEISESTGISMNALLNIGALELIRQWMGNDSIILDENTEIDS